MWNFGIPVCVWVCEVKGQVRSWDLWKVAGPGQRAAHNHMTWVIGTGRHNVQTDTKQALAYEIHVADLVGSWRDRFRVQQMRYHIVQATLSLANLCYSQFYLSPRQALHGFLCSVQLTNRRTDDQNTLSHPLRTHVRYWLISQLVSDNVVDWELLEFFSVILFFSHLRRYEKLIQYL